MKDIPGVPGAQKNPQTKTNLKLHVLLQTT